MANADGSVIIKAEIDDKQAQRELTALERKIESLQDKLNTKKSGRDSLFEQAKALGGELDAAKAKLSDMKSGSAFFTTDSIKQQQAAVAAMEKEWNSINDQLDKQNVKLQQDEATLNRMKERAGELKRQISNTSKSSSKIKAGFDKASAGMESFSKRVGMLAKRALVFTVIAQALAKLRDWLADVVTVNDDARQAIAELKGALMTLAQPLVEVIIPAFTALVRILANIVSLIANVVSGLFGTTAKDSAAAAKSLNDQKNALKGVGSAAKSASRQLASFDEINKLNSDTGGSTGGAIAADFSKIGNFDFLDAVSDKLKKIAQDVFNMVKDVIGFFKNFFTGNWDEALGNVIDFVGHTCELLSDLLDFASEIFGSLIDVIIEKCGLAGKPVGEMLLGIKDTVQGVLGLISGILSLDLEKMKESVVQIMTGIKEFVFGIFDLISDGVMSLLDKFDELTDGKLRAIVDLAKSIVSAGIEGIKTIFGGLTEFIAGVFTGDWKKAWEGIKDIFRGIWNTIVGILEAAVNLIIRGVNWIVDQLNKIHFDIPDWVPLVGGKSFGVNISHVNELKIPRLAQGAVIPPNKEFLAVLGDQTSGTNVEAPLSTIQQAAAQAFAEMAPEFAAAIVQAFTASGTLGNIRNIEGYAKTTAQKELSLGRPSSTTGRWVSQALEAYDAVRG